MIKYSAQDRVAQVLPIPLLNLKHICLDMMALVVDYGLLLIGIVIRSSPNLETFTFSITCVKHSEWISEMEFVKLMLAKSPVLKKARIILGTEVTEDEGSRMCKMFLDSPRASQMADIIVEHSHEEEN
ncbi:hypothetical protein Tco_1494162 [Tanacetum coccineum]